MTYKGRVRRSVTGLVGLVLLAGATLAAPSESPRVLVEDWSRQPDDRTGIPEGWQGQFWGSPRYDFAVISEDDGKVLRLRSWDDNSIISKEIRVDIRRFPLLVWRWKVTLLPAGGDARRKEADDQAAQVYVTFPRFPTALRSRIIGYLWDTTAPVGTTVKQEAGRAATYVVVRSGGADVGRWVIETRDVFKDYRSLYGEEPGEEARVLSVGIDSNDTHSNAEAHVGEIFFRTP
jgi:hypothetical protein